MVEEFIPANLASRDCGISKYGNGSREDLNMSKVLAPHRVTICHNSATSDQNQNFVIL